MIPPFRPRLVALALLLSIASTRSALPAEAAPDDRGWGIATLSVCSARERPDHTAEMGTQISLGHTVRVLQAAEGWLYVEAPSGYRAWVEPGTLVRCNRAQAETWENGPLVIVTALESVIASQPDRHSEPVGDVIIGNLLKPVGTSPGWLRVALPDGRTGFLEADAAADYRTWRQQRQPTAASIEATARRFLGRPYLWGGNSPKGLDCSGFTQLVFGLNGISLPHQASQQAGRGALVPLEPNRARLLPGDLLFFGQAATPTQPERVFHVGIYLNDALVIHAAARVQLNRLDELIAPPDAPGRRVFLRARRLLP